MTRISAALLLFVTLAILVAVPEAAGPRRVAASPDSLAYVNGELTRVYFNDGDTFRMTGGPYPNRPARLGGFNTLESYGPVHRWGAWHAYELYVLAKLGTLNGRRGVWHCTSNGETDTYGRVLLDCPDLAVDQIRKGYAHAMTIDDTPSRPEYLRAQQEAIAARRGIWAHGVPEFIMTSTHSMNEYWDRDEAKNRMISTRDGHSEPMVHQNNYAECEWVCASEVRADAERVHAVARALRADPAVGPTLAEVSQVLADQHYAEVSHLLLIEIVDRYARMQQLPTWVTPAQREALEPRLAQAHANGELGTTTLAPGSCNLYVPFERRYNRERPACLRGHGDAH